MEQKFLHYRAQVALKNYNAVLSQIKSQDPLELQSVKLLAKYESSKESVKTLLNELDTLLQESGDKNPYVCIIASTVFYKEKLYEDALRLTLSLSPVHLEWYAHFYNVLLNL